ncbi:MAG: hypothetical protein IPL26_30035 [Leptospiraceae bacterium]|nr:hypothetical protein [Leptospiraceae bacterium]
MLRTKTDFTIKLNPKKGNSLSAQIIEFKYMYVAKGGKWLAFNDATGKFTVDAVFEPIVVKTVIATNIQAVIGARTKYDDGKKQTPTTQTQPDWTQVVDIPPPTKPTPKVVSVNPTPQPTIPKSDPVKTDSGGDGLLVLIGAALAFFLF